MRQVVLYLFMIAALAFMALMINKRETEPSPKLLTVKTDYRFIDDSEQPLYFEFYTSTKNHPLLLLDSYEQLIIHNETETTQLTLVLKEIIYLHEESYLNDLYYKFSYLCEAPLLEMDFYLEEAFLTIVLVNNDQYTFYLGSIGLITPNESTNHLDWQALSGEKKPGSFLSRLAQIKVEFNGLNQSIHSIYVDGVTPSEFYIENQTLIVLIDEQNALLNACPVVIWFQDGSHQLLPYFIYIKDFEILKNSGPLIYHYALNTA
ncbi:MAG: hypothetical protein WC225_03730 [Acholeplasmataceae bacterium]|nr:hypothetical protein [Acholeplasmataceae bacterium]